jgi:uncharacterized protein YcbX
MKKLTLSEIWIYPIKSLGGIRLERARVMGKGLQFDRRWMLIDEDGVALTQRVHPVMALFNVTIESDEIFVGYRKNATTLSTIHFSTITPVSDKWITARIWNDQVQVLEVNRRVSSWFSRHLNVPCKLVLFPEKKPRPVDPRYSIKHEQVALADAYPFLIIGQTSLDDLNARLNEPIPMNRFRPNFVFTGGAAFAEDLWKDISIGNIRFVAVKKCERCAIPTINQDTAEKAVEPLRTLTTYRKIDNKVVFGQNLIGLDEGEVSIGDAVIPA